MDKNLFQQQRLIFINIMKMSGSEINEWSFRDVEKDKDRAINIVASYKGVLVEFWIQS